MSFLYENIQEFPVDIGQTDVTLRAVNVVGYQDNPFNLSRETQVFPGARWEIEISILPMVRAEAQKLEAFLLSLRGRLGLFRCADPYRSLPLGSNLGDPEVLLAEAGEESFTSQGWTASQSGLLLAGDWLEIRGYLHMVINPDDVNSDAEGNATIMVWPPLRSDFATGTDVITENARGVFALDSNSTEFVRNVSGFNGIIIRAVEVPTKTPPDPEEITLTAEEITLGGEPLTVTPED